jgi:hypothetical protein
MITATLLASCGGNTLKARADMQATTASAAGGDGAASGLVAGPALAPNERIAFPVPRTLDGVRLEDVAAHGSDGLFFVDFRVRRPLPTSIARVASTELAGPGTSLTDLNDLAYGDAGINRIPTRRGACYTAYLTGNVNAVPGRPVQVAVLLTDSPASAANTLRADIRLSRTLPPDFLISRRSATGGVEDAEGPYARRLGCETDAGGEVSNTEYCRLFAMHSPRLGPNPKRSPAAVCR